MSENDKKLISRSRSSKPSLELYKPPVLRGKKSLPRKVQDVQSEFLEENIQKEISLLSSNEENKEEASQLPKSPLKIPSKSTEISQKQQKQSIKKSEEKLESILSLLMIIGHRLELDYPLQTDELRILLRNASLNSTECWARKMILLMVELGAVNWKIVPQIEEFYYTL
uniref:Uncharacterized protein n=1 Tax=Meloidogyne javanica TaxID=6303 RepID=A0A915N0Z5_MELJA